MVHNPFQNLVKNSETAIFTEATIPEKLLSRHNTKQGVWGKLMVITGALDFVVDGPPSTISRIEAGTYAVIEPTIYHHVQIIGPTTFRIEFYRG